jgi:hypothetical protein
VLRLHFGGAAALVSQEAQMFFRSSSQQSKVQIPETLQKVQFWLTHLQLPVALTAAVFSCARFNRIPSQTVVPLLDTQKVQDQFLRPGQNKSFYFAPWFPNAV